MTPVRPFIITLVAQTCIWGGLLIFVGGLYGAATAYLDVSGLKPKAETIYPKNSEAFLVGYTPFYEWVRPLMPAVTGVLGLLLFLAGTGMLKMRRSSRYLAKLFCALMILLCLAYLGYVYVVVLPGLDEWFIHYQEGWIPDARSVQIGFLAAQGLSASLLPLMLIVGCVVLWHALGRPMFANSLVFFNRREDKPRKEKRAGRSVEAPRAKKRPRSHKRRPS